MASIAHRLRLLESRILTSEQPRIVVLNPGESKIDALRRLDISEQSLDSERAAGRRVIWVRWAG